MNVKIKKATIINILGILSLIAITAASITLVRACTGDAPLLGVIIGTVLMAVWVACLLGVGYLENKKP